MSPDLATHDVRETFTSLEQWVAYADRNPWTYNAAFIASIADHVVRHGLHSRALGPAPAGSVIVSPPSYRESLLADGCTSRSRALLDEICDIAPNAKSVLLLEAVTPFADHVRARFPGTIATEYLPNPDDRARLPNVAHCDILASGFDNARFDLVVSGDVLEHVPDLDRALAEMRRILAPGGRCIATFPFATKSAQTDIRAKMNGDLIEHVATPEYHGNPVDPQGSLVFAIPGWDILEKCLAAGFRDAAMVFVSSAPRGIVANACGGVFILNAAA